MNKRTKSQDNRDAKNYLYYPAKRDKYEDKFYNVIKFSFFYFRRPAEYKNFGNNRFLPTICRIQFFSLYLLKFIIKFSIILVPRPYLVRFVASAKSSLNLLKPTPVFILIFVQFTDQNYFVSLALSDPKASFH